MATVNIKNIFSKLVFVIGCLFTIVYFLSCLTPYINPTKFYIFTFLPLLFPILLAGMLVWVLISFIFYRRKSWIFLLILFLGIKNICSTFSFNIPKAFVQEKQATNIRLLSWNVEDFLDSQLHTDTVGNARRDMIAFIKEANADIVCIQDFSEKISPAFRSGINDVKATNNYPYFVFNKDFDKQYYYARSQYGTAVFSKYPIIDSGCYKYADNHFPESLAFVDVKYNADTIRVFNTHLQSMYLKYVAVETDSTNDFIKDKLDFLLKNTQPHQRIRYFDVRHVAQAKMVKNVLNICKYPFIFCADLNSVPASYVYHTIQNNLTDAFIAKGSGISGTYDGIAPTLRIDVVLMSKQLQPVQYYSPKLHYSNHFPIITDLQIK